MASRTRLSNIIWPLLLIAAGLILLLNNTGMIDTDLIGLVVRLWPILLIIWAVQMWLTARMIFFPLTLFLAGVAFLLDNYGVLDWNVWLALSKLWPLIFVALGLDVLIGARRFNAEEREETAAQALDDATSVRVEVEPGLGNTSLDIVATADALVTASTTVGGDQQLAHSHRRNHDEAVIKFKREGEWLSFFSGSWLGTRQWRLALNPTIPTLLKIDGSLGARTINLGAARLAELNVDGGFGALTITLPGQGALSAKIDTGLGDATILIPAGMSARIKIDSGLGRRQIQGEFLQVGDNLVSPDFDRAANRIDLAIDHGLGGLTIAQI